MKKGICLLLCVLLLCLAACGKTGGEWTREGYFTDENENYLMIFPSEEEQYEGWSVSCMIDGEMRGWFIPQVDDTLHGDLVSEYEEGSYVVTISEEGEDGLLLEVEGGESYHFFPMEVEEAAFTVRINTEGLGRFAYAEEGEALEFDDDFPTQSAQLNLAGPATYGLEARADEGWQFVKWTKDGEDFSTEARITVEFTEDAEFVAVFDAK